MQEFFNRLANVCRWIATIALVCGGAMYGFTPSSEAFDQALGPLVTGIGVWVVFLTLAYLMTGSVDGRN